MVKNNNVVKISDLLRPFVVLRKYRDYITHSTRITLSNRYSNMYMGIIWWFLDPLFLMLTYAFVYLYVFNVSTPNYFVFLLIGLIVWRWISNSISQNTVSITSKVGILEQIPAPKQIFPMVSQLVETILFAAAFILVIIAVVLDNIPITWHYIELLPVAAITFIFLYGIGLVVAHAGAFVADLKPALTYFLRLLFYLSPIFYSITILPSNLQTIFYLNPITIIVQNFRGIIIDGMSPNYGDMLFILIIGLTFLLIGWLLIELHDRDYGRLK